MDPEDFRKLLKTRYKVMKRCEIFSKDSGFIFAGIRNILPAATSGSMIAAYEAVNEFTGNKSHLP